MATNVSDKISALSPARRKNVERRAAELAVEELASASELKSPTDRVMLSGLAPLETTAAGKPTERE